MMAAQPASTDQQIAALRQGGAQGVDPVRLRYLEVLARRAQGQNGRLRAALEQSLQAALDDAAGALERARSEAAAALAQAVQAYPQAAAELQHHFQAAEFAALRQAIVRLQSRRTSSALGALVRDLGAQAFAPADGAGPRPAESQPGAPSDLKSVHNFRNTWSKLSADKQVNQALEQAPRNAGPINSHMLVLRSLALMREVSPDYLSRFVAYADALQCLDRYDPERPSYVRPGAEATAAKKVKAVRARRSKAA